MPTTLRSAAARSYRISVVALALLVAGSAGAAVFTVDSTEDDSDTDPGDGVCETASGECTLRAALEEQDQLAGFDEIEFDLPADDVVIQPLDALDVWTEDLRIDGTTQPGYAGSPIVTVDGAYGGAADGGLLVRAGTEVRGLVFINWSSSHGISVDTGHDEEEVVIAGNYLGVDRSGSVAAGNEVGVWAYGVNITIGGEEEEDRNVISANYIGIHAQGDQIRILGNYVGTDASGTVAMGNEGWGIVALSEGFTFSDIVVGSPGAGNVISGNGRAGLWGGPQRLTFQANLVGTDASGTVALPNGWSDEGLASGLQLESGGGHAWLIGGPGEGEGNTFAANIGDGIGLWAWSYEDTVVVQGNHIGVTPDGAPLGNSRSGIHIGIPTTASIGGVVDGHANAIAYNSGPGIDFPFFEQGDIAATVRGNAIYSNGGLGIDLGEEGPTEPVPYLVQVDGGVGGTFTGLASTTYTLDFYGNEPERHREGEVWLGAMTAFTDSSGEASFEFQVPAGSLECGRLVTATATTTATGTSEFSEGVPLLGDGDCDGHLAIESGGDDCDDTDPEVYPGATERAYDGVDQDCDGEDLCDVDGDGHDAEQCPGGDDCDDSDRRVEPGAPETAYDGVDQDCDRADLCDVDGDGHDAADERFCPGGDDCDDSDPDVHEGCGANRQEQEASSGCSTTGGPAGGGILGLSLLGPLVSLHRRRSTTRGLSCAALALLLAAPASAAVFAVDSTSDDSDASPGDGLCATAAGECTLRAALEEHDELDGFDEVEFDLPPGDTVIQPASAFYPVGDIRIDGTTQPGFAGTPIVTLDGSHCDAYSSLTLINGGEVRGLVITNFEWGIEVYASDGGEALIAGNYVGVDASGAVAAPNGIGISVQWGDVAIGGPAVEDRNVISGNTFGIYSHADELRVLGNYIGTDATGSFALGNTYDGVRVEGRPGNVAVLGSPGAGNLISGNGGNGVFGRFAQLTMQDNLVGTDASGSMAIPNGESGLCIEYLDGANSMLIGGPGEGEGNLISGNTGDGVKFEYSWEAPVVFQGNHIGVTTEGAPLSNGGNGLTVQYSGDGVVVGGVGAGQGNHIAFNSGAGVRYLDLDSWDLSAEVRGNSIHSNGGLGIDLGEEGATEPHPVLDEGYGAVSGSFTGEPSTTYTLDFYGNDTGRDREGEAWLDFMTVFTDSSGQASFEFTAPEGTLECGDVVTATATASATGTSEFSEGAAVLGDEDCDGHLSVEAGGGDCDDSDPGVYPGAPEQPYDGVDQDCDGADLCDVDRDGYDSVQCPRGDDCDDGDTRVYPGARESAYDGVDQDCDGADLCDVDGDGHDAADQRYCLGGDDCDDTDPDHFADCGVGRQKEDASSGCSTAGAPTGRGAFVLLGLGVLMALRRRTSPRVVGASPRRRGRSTRTQWSRMDSGSMQEVDVRR